MQKNTHTHTHRDSNEYPIVAFSKNATIMINCQEAQTIPDCIRSLVSLAITLNHRRSFLLDINTLACVKTEI